MIDIHWSYTSNCLNEHTFSTFRSLFEIDKLYLLVYFGSKIKKILVNCSFKVKLNVTSYQHPGIILILTIMLAATFVNKQNP